MNSNSLIEQKAQEKDHTIRLHSSPKTVVYYFPVGVSCSSSKRPIIEALK
jgi:hypothetical protein